VLCFNDNEDYATRDGDWRRGTSFLDADDVLGVELHDDNVAAGAIMKLFLKRRFGKVQGCSARSPCKKAEASNACVLAYGSQCVLAPLQVALNGNRFALHAGEEIS